MFPGLASATAAEAAAEDLDSDVSLSDDDVPGGEELLSHLIEAAMPKKRHHWKAPAAHANIRGRPVIGGAVQISNGPRRPTSRSVEPPTHRAGRNKPMSQLHEFHSLRNHVSDSGRQLQLTNKNTVSPPTEQTQLHTIDAANPSPVYTWTAEPSEDHVVSYAVEGTPGSYSRNLSPQSQRVGSTATAVNRSLSKTSDASCHSSLSSLSFDSSLNAEPTAEESALLAECINAALPKKRSGNKTQKKYASHQHHQSLRTSPSGSSEASYKHGILDCFVL